MVKQGKTGHWAAAMIFAGAMASPAFADESPAGVAPVVGVWQKHEYSFTFMGFTSTYSCDGLADKLKLLLITAGARPDVKAQAGACAAGFGRPDKFAQASLTFYTLTPSTVEADGGPTLIPSLWRSVALSARKPFELQTGDCELVEQFRTAVLPMFTTRRVENHTTCIPHQDSGSSIDLSFESLAAAPPKVPASAAKPGV